MKQLKRTPNIWKATNLFLDTEKMKATSYVWWTFLSRIEGKIVFNDYCYSVTTSKHQNKVRGVLSQLGVKVDMFLPVPQGLQTCLDLSEAILKAEEYLCDKFLNEELKREERNLKARFRRDSRKLTEYLENSVCFRDYEIKQVRQFGHINKIAVHQIIEMKSLEHDVQNAIHNFHRDGFGNVVFYV